MVVTGEDLDRALETLQKVGVIDSPDYWIIASSVMNYLNILLVNASQLCKEKNDLNITSFDSALSLCGEKNVLTDTFYWSRAASTNKYVDKLIINIANHL